jgi:hypothetical protein
VYIINTTTSGRISLLPKPFSNILKSKPRIQFFNLVLSLSIVYSDSLSTLELLLEPMDSSSSKTYISINRKWTGIFLSTFRVIRLLGYRINQCSLEGIKTGPYKVTSFSLINWSLILIVL